MSVDTATRARARPTLATDLLALTKPRIALLVLATTAGAMMWAAEGSPGTALLWWTLVGMALLSGGAAALNHLIDRDLDRKMDRTADRPVASGRVSPTAAGAFGLVLCAAGSAALWFGANPVAAALGTGGAGFYVVIYTALLKRRTPQNIVIGGAAGALPPVAGWAAVTGTIDLAPLVMFLIIFLWTPPHFWALAMIARDDYAKAGIPMLPVTAGLRATARQILVYTALLAAVSVVPTIVGLLGIVYLVVAIVLAARFLQLAAALVRSQTRATARATFLYSLGYLALLFGAMGVDRAIAF